MATAWPFPSTGRIALPLTVFSRRRRPAVPCETVPLGVEIACAAPVPARPGRDNPMVRGIFAYFVLQDSVEGPVPSRFHLPQDRSL